MVDPVVKATVSYHWIVKKTVITSNPLIHEICYIIFRISVPTSQRTSLSITETSRLMLYGEKQLNEKSWIHHMEILQFFSVKANGTYSYHCAWKGLQCNVVIMIHLLCCPYGLFSAFAVLWFSQSWTAVVLN